MPPGAFSRIALAAALLEYDNDANDPSIPQRKASDSAIFAHLRRTGPVPRPESVLEYDDLPAPRRSTDYLHVPLPSDQGSLMGRRDSLDVDGMLRTSLDQRKSLDVLREYGEQYFEQAKEKEVDDVSVVDDVDLSSWGLDSFIPPKEKGKKREQPATKPGPGRRRPASEHLDHLPNPHSPQTPTSPSYPSISRSTGQSRSNVRSMSFGPDHGLDNAFMEEPGPPSRRHTVMGSLDILGEGSSSQHPPGSYLSVPFPSSPTGDAPRNLDAEEDGAFAVPLPTGDRLSKFDPKAARHARTISGGSWSSKLAVEPTVGATGRDRTHSNISLGTRGMLGDADGASLSPSFTPENRRLSRLELMRPKLLVMPSPLRGSENGPGFAPDRLSSAGFEITTERPLPPGFRGAPARPGMRASQSAGAIPILGESFTPNPRMTLSASQLMFRNSLMVGGQRDVSYVDMDQGIRRANADGERVEEELDPEEADAEFREMHRPAGKLLGRSLIDDLQARKAEIQGKKRVFRGDERPSMMDRGLTRSSTLVNLDGLNVPQPAANGRPNSQTLLAPPPSGTRNPKRASGMPLVDLNDKNDGFTRLPKGQSVFGVDTLWQRELTKLEALEAAEKVDKDAQARREEVKAGRKGKGKKDKGTPSPKSEVSPTPSAQPGDAFAPTLPEVPLVSTRAPRPPRSPNDSEDGEAVGMRRVSVATLGVNGWFAGGSSDEEEDEDYFGPGAVPGNQRRRKKQRAGSSRVVSGHSDQPPRLPRIESSDEEDEPLAARIAKARAAPPRLVSKPVEEDDSDEDAPISTLIAKSRLGGSPAGPSTVKQTPPVVPKTVEDDDDDDEEDNVPLGLRAAPTTKPPVDGDSDEDEKPLGLRFTPGQQQQQQPDFAAAQQYQMMMALQQQQVMQQQQQQMLAMRNSMAGFGVPSMMPHFTGAAHPPSMYALPPPPPQLPESSSRGRVDAWRQEVIDNTSG